MPAEDRASTNPAMTSVPNCSSSSCEAVGRCDGRSLTAGTPPSVGAEDARRTLEFAAATFASAFRGAPVAAGDIVDPDPFRSRMDGDMVPWPPVKEAL